MGCAVVSVRRLLAQVGYHSSFTHNAGWYTLAGMPRFGRDGLWFYQLAKMPNLPDRITPMAEAAPMT
jgi:hypothetical protein